MPKITISQDLAREVQSLCQELLKSEAPFINVVISGGSLIPLIGQNLNSPKVRIFFADERCVPIEDSASNYGTFIRGIKGQIQCTVICPFEGKESVLASNEVSESQSCNGKHSILKGKESPLPSDQSAFLNRAAMAYEEKIRTFFPNGMVQFDLLLLGIGPDGHTASLFPNDSNLSLGNSLIVATNNAPKAPAQRISLSARCISTQSKGKVVFVAGGREKNPVLRRVLLEEVKESEEVPFSLFAKNATFILDTESGEGMSEGEF
jgi:6-phosphogluconolactonase